MGLVLPAEILRLLIHSLPNHTIPLSSPGSGIKETTMEIINTYFDIILGEDSSFIFYSEIKL